MQRAHLLSRLVDPSEAQLSRLTHELPISSFTTGKPRKKHLKSLLHITYLLDSMVKMLKRVISNTLVIREAIWFIRAEIWKLVSIRPDLSELSFQLTSVLLINEFT